MRKIKCDMIALQSVCKFFFTKVIAKTFSFEDCSNNKIFIVFLSLSCFAKFSLNLTCKCSFSCCTTGFLLYLTTPGKHALDEFSSKDAGKRGTKTCNMFCNIAVN